MSVEYDKYLAAHISNVQKGLDWFRGQLPDILRPADSVNLEMQFAQHDASKRDKEEYDSYDAYFYGPSKSYKVIQDFNRAWLHHIHQNPHHWQHWVLYEDDPKNGKTPILIEMPYNYILEMVCDWWAFSWASGDLFEIFNWWDAHKDTIRLHPNSRKIVIDILSKLEKELEVYCDVVLVDVEVGPEVKTETKESVAD